MKSKNAQFYILAAVIIIIVVTGLVTIVNYLVTKPEPAKLYDLSKQLEKESTRLINYGVATNQEDIGEVIDNFIKSEFLVYLQQ